MHNITDSTENYLEAIYVMSKKAGSVRSVDIARFSRCNKAFRQRRDAQIARSQNIFAWHATA